MGKDTHSHSLLASAQLSLHQCSDTVTQQSCFLRKIRAQERKDPHLSPDYRSLCVFGG